jgi:rod shape determining protein RodA
VWAEEHGFVGALVLLALFAVLLVLAAGIAQNARDPHGTYLAMGVGGMIFWQVFVNIGMVTGLLPVVGVTLPFMSYGGSSLVTTCLGVGILLNVWMRRFMF